MSADFQVGETYIFIVDTDKYSGNFEREMCAYMTGCVGECGVGSEEADIFFDETGIDPYNNPWEDIVDRQSDEHGCYRPVSIWPTPGWSNNGMGKHTQLKPGEKVQWPAYQSVAIFMSKQPTYDEIKILQRRAEEYTEYRTKSDYSWEREKINILGFRMQKFVGKIEDINENP